MLPWAALSSLERPEKIMRKGKIAGREGEIAGTMYIYIYVCVYILLLNKFQLLVRLEK